MWSNHSLLDSPRICNSIEVNRQVQYSGLIVPHIMSGYCVSALLLFPWLESPNPLESRHGLPDCNLPETTNGLPTVVRRLEAFDRDLATRTKDLLGPFDYVMSLVEFLVE